jgi:hypothetical protein
MHFENRLQGLGMVVLAAADLKNMPSSSEAGNQRLQLVTVNTTNSSDQGAVTAVERTSGSSADPFPGKILESIVEFAGRAFFRRKPVCIRKQF